jgi:predicted ferric reductase
MQFWESITWVVARAGGFTAYGLLALAVIVGLALSLHWQSPQWPRLINAELHNFLTLLSTVFLVVHVGAVIVDPFTHFTLLQVFVPFASTYRPLWMGLGVVALYLGIAIGISTLLRKRIGYTLWRQLHTLTLAIFVLATIHGIFTGTDAHSWWAVSIYVASVGVVGTLFLLRLAQPGAKTRPASQRPAQARQSWQGRRACAGLTPRPARLDITEAAQSLRREATRPIHHEPRAPFPPRFVAEYQPRRHASCF